MIAQLLYGTGMRLLEALRLRVKDVEFARREIVIREGKGNKDRVGTRRCRCGLRLALRQDASLLFVPPSIEHRTS
ncbi:tyrosine-type recombinase/integrase [Ramlibacter sp. H39-3-26]|uniref:tyrosine-type recombinase/integrase n=1 Tax=Curvibacter soli TaxID=3031331 RepID=UPI0023DB9B7D|nr:tyrosine-type recombinase/integrase [Ramlibacter sp. H39-3-26]MDF1486638.1 tyrosine-type recombinase/integrase [Ramlibacter sp. H39-3-26]